jgi:hypothetical protein
MPQQTMPGAPPNLLKSSQIFVPKYWRNYFSLPNLLIELPDCQIEFVLPNRIAESTN